MKEVDIDDIVCVVIDYVMDDLGFKVTDDAEERADVYRKVGSELLNLARMMEHEIDRGMYQGD